MGVRVKPLVWAKSHIMGWNEDYHTVPMGYTVRCADENGWKWQGHGAFGYGSSSTTAQSAAQADYERRILSALIEDDGYATVFPPLKQSEGGE